MIHSIQPQLHCDGETISHVHTIKRSVDHDYIPVSWFSLLLTHAGYCSMLPLSASCGRCYNVGLQVVDLHSTMHFPNTLFHVSQHCPTQMSTEMFNGRAEVFFYFWYCSTESETVNRDVTSLIEHFKVVLWASSHFGEVRSNSRSLKFYKMRSHSVSKSAYSASS